MINPALDFVTFVAAQVPELVPGQNLFEGPISEGVQEDAVFVRTIGGPEPMRFIDSSNEIRTVSVATVVRNVSLSAAVDLSRKILNSTNGLLAPTGYLDAKAIQGEPTDSGKDDAGRFRRTVTHQLRFQVDT